MPLANTSTFIDGFPSDPALSDYGIQSVIDGDLRTCEELAGTEANMGMRYPAYFAAGANERAGWVGPALRRFAWNRGRQPWESYLRRLLQLLLGWKPEPPSPENLLVLAQLGPDLAIRGADDCDVGPPILAALRKSKEPLSPELLAALRTLVGHFTGITSHGPPTFAIAWRVWREDGENGGPCFSARVRADLRSMAGDESAGWSSLLEIAMTASPTHR
jgi:hypothetical protein